jgi:hypothetical protein
MYYCPSPSQPIMDITGQSPHLRYHHYSSRTSSFDFLQALDAFLARNRIDFIGSFRMRLEPTANKNWTFLVVGETSESSLEISDQVVLGTAWPGLPSPPNEVSISSSSSDVIHPRLFISFDVPSLTGATAFSLRGRYAC